MRKEVTDQVKENLEYWKEEIPREVFKNPFLSLPVS